MYDKRVLYSSAAHSPRLTATHYCFSHTTGRALIYPELLGRTAHCREFCFFQLLAELSAAPLALQECRPGCWGHSASAERSGSCSAVCPLPGAQKCGLGSLLPHSRSGAGTCCAPAAARWHRNAKPHPGKSHYCCCVRTALHIHPSAKASSGLLTFWQSHIEC